MIDRSFIWRVALVAIFLFATWSALGARLVQLHLGENASLQERIRKMRTLRQSLEVGRGRIFDRNGNLLALDLTTQNVVVSPETLARNEQGLEVSRELSRLLGLPLAQVRGRVERPGRQYEVIARQLPEARAQAVTNLKVRGVWLEPVSTRHYPQGDLACHVVGFSNMEGEGSAGIEQRWDSFLKGRPGVRLSEKDGRRGEVYGRRSLEVAPEEGANVHLTLDQNVQYFVEKGLDWAMTNLHPQAAWAIVQEVRTGAILAMAARPAFDLNLYARTSADERMNRAVAYNFEPGSIFKIGVIAAALNEGVVATNDVFDCEMGQWRYAGRPLRDFHAYGNLDVAGVLRKSSNIGSAKIALMLGDERLHRYLKAFGVGRLTGIELPGEERGLLAPPSRWTALSATRIAMGHEVAVTALQMLGVMSCIGNDGFLMRPHVVSRVEDSQGVVLHESAPEILSRPITERTAAVMRHLLSEVTQEGGTGTRAAIPGYHVAGKTGTAEKIVNGHYVRNENVSSFLGMLPAERPEIAIIVVLDDPQPVRTGGQTAAPAFAQMAAPIARYLDIHPVDAADLVYYERIIGGEP